MTTFPTNPDSEVRRYRRLLWAYPAAYRRRHGAEIVTTLLDMAEAGRGRPRLAWRLHLVACGIRQRFRLPANRPLTAITALLAAVALGAAGALAGAALSWHETATPRPFEANDGQLAWQLSERPAAGVQLWEIVGTPRPAGIIAGMLLGIIGGWLLAAALAGRVRHSGRTHRRWVASLGMIATGALVVPNVGVYRDLIVFLVDGAPGPHIVLTLGTAPPPTLVIDLMSHEQLFTALISTGLALLALVTAIVVAARGTHFGPDNEQGAVVPS